MSKRGFNLKQMNSFGKFEEEPSKRRRKAKVKIGKHGDLKNKKK